MVPPASGFGASLAARPTHSTSPLRTCSAENRVTLPPCSRQRHSTYCAPHIRVAKKTRHGVARQGLLDDLRHSFSSSFSSVDDVPVNVVRCVTDETYQELLDRAPGQLVVVDFYAEWCKPCKKLSPLLTKMAVMHPHVVIATYKCDRTCPALPKSLGITSFPTFLLYRDGEKIGMLKGANSAGELMQIVANHNKLATASD